MLVLLGCSKQSPSSPPATPTPATATAVPKIMVVVTPEALERRQVKQQALTLLNDQDYDGLEVLAAKYRASQECHASGLWKLQQFYAGLAHQAVAAEPLWQSRERELRKWLQARPASMTAHVALAEFLADYAWKARGNDVADVVTETGWRLMAERLQAAGEILEAVSQREDKCPVYWSTRQTIALGQELKRARYDELFKQAIKAFPDFEDYYNRRAVFLLPRWHGTDGELARDLDKSADRVGGDAGDMLYARVVWSLHGYGSTNVFKEHNLSWERTARGFDAIIKKFPDSLQAQNEAAHLASLAHDQPSARKYFLLTQGQVDLTLWRNKDRFVACYKWALGM